VATVSVIFDYISLMICIIMLIRSLLFSSSPAGVERFCTDLQVKSIKFDVVKFEMAEVNQATVKNVNIYQGEIDVVKFDGTNNFDMWKCEVMDALTLSNLEDALLLENKPKEISEKEWDRMNRTACRVIRSCLTEHLKYHVMNETSARKIWDILEDMFLSRSIENRLHLKRRLYRFRLNKRISIGENMNNYNNLLADLASLKVVIEDEDKALVLLSSLSDEEYETFVLPFINGKKSLSYNKVSAALVNHELRKKDKRVFH